VIFTEKLRLDSALVNFNFTYFLKRHALTIIVVVLCSCFSATSPAASLFGDFSCQTWAELPYSKKRIWTNAFLAPLSLTYQGLERTKPDRYNDDPNAADPAIKSIDSFCLLHQELGPADAAVSYLNGLIEQ